MANGRIRKRRRGPWIAALTAAAIGVPVVAHALIRRRARPPQAPRWGRSHRFAGRRGSMLFQELGDGPPVVLLHGLGPGFDGAQWRGVAEELGRSHRVLVPDLPGWGRSAETIDPDPAVFIDAIAGFLGGVAWEPAVLVATGLPASFAATVAAERPDLVRALGLVTPLGLGSQEAGAGALLGPGSTWRQQLIAAALGMPLVAVTALDLLTRQTALDHTLREEVYAAPERVDAAVLDHHYRVSHRPECRHGLAAYLRGHLHFDPSAALAAIHQPVWLCWGEQSKHPPLAAADLWLHRLPGAQLDVISGTGMLPHAERPAAVARALSRFLAGLPARSEPVPRPA